MFSQDPESLELVEEFKIYPGYVAFDGYLELVKEEANYWKGYTHYLETVIRERKLYPILDQGLALVKRATNLRQSIYSDAALLEKAEAYSKRQDDLEKRIVLKAFELVKLRSQFRDYLFENEIRERLPNNKKFVEKDEKDE